MNTILLNWLPPADIHSPSLCLSTLKGHMKKHGFHVEVIYWNLLFSEIPGIEDLPFAPLVPFLMEWRYRRGVSQSRIRGILLGSLSAPYMEKKKFDSLVEEVHENINEIIDSVLRDHLHRQDVLLWGFSSKYYQWIPAAVIAESLKKLAPQVTVVLGGMGTQREAESLLRVCSMFDIGIWGEGEIPLQTLSLQLKQKDPAFDSLQNAVLNYQGATRTITSPGADTVNLNEAAIPDYDDYFAQVNGHVAPETIDLPIESSRGCYWNRCRFCCLTEGYTHRLKEPGKLLDDIRQLQEKHGVNRFTLVDLDLVGRSTNRFDTLVKAMCDHNQKSPWPISFCGAEINPVGIGTETITMMATAGLTHIQIGLEAFSDKLLRKMDKRTSVAQNLHFVTHATRSGVSISANVIPGLPDETLDDVIESMENLHYFRFCLSKERLSVSMSRFGMKSTTPYFQQITSEERKLWRDSPLCEAFPSGIMTEEETYDLFVFAGNQNASWWGRFEKRLAHYYKNEWSYTVDRCEGRCLLEERLNGKLQRSLELSPIQRELLQLLNRGVSSLESVHNRIATKSNDVPLEMIRSMIRELQSEFIIYCNADFSEIASAICV